MIKLTVIKHINTLRKLRDDKDAPITSEQREALSYLMNAMLIQFAANSVWQIIKLVTQVMGG